MSLSSLPSFCQKFSQLVEIWQSSDKNDFAQLFETRCIVVKSIHTSDSSRQLSRVGVGGVIGHKRFLTSELASHRTVLRCSRSESTVSVIQPMTDVAAFHSRPSCHCNSDYYQLFSIRRLKANIRFSKSWQTELFLIVFSKIVSFRI